MATASDGAAPSSSYFRKTVCLSDWWLIKAEQDFDGKRLAVAGVTSQEKQAVRAFTSAPILSRSDPLTLETADGIFVLIDSCLNKVRTEENGFPYEIFSHFVFGFPTNWEEYAVKCSEKVLSNKDVSTTLDCDKLSTDSGTANDIGDGTPNRNKACVSEERRSTSNNMDVGSEEKGQNKPEDDNSDGTLNRSQAAVTEERHGTHDKMDVRSEEKGHHEPQDGACNDSSLKGISLSEGRMCAYLSSRIKSKLKSDPKTVKPVDYEDDRLTSGSSSKSSMRNAVINGRRTSRHRSTSIPSASGLKPTDNETVDGNIACQAGKKGEKTSKTPRSSPGLIDANRIDDLKVAGSKKETSVKNASISGKTTKRKLTYVSPVTTRGTKKTAFVSPESLNVKRSRSGRLLLPSLEFWRNQLVIYGPDHQITGIQEGPLGTEPSRGSRSEPQRKRGKLQ